MKTISHMSLLLLALLCLEPLQAQEDTSTVLFTWIWYKDTLGTINVPGGFKSCLVEYGEGCITTLAYRDGSLLGLHFGGTIKLPFHGAPEYIVQDSVKYKDRTQRSGRARGSLLRWREDAYGIFNTFFERFIVSFNRLFLLLIARFTFLLHRFTLQLRRSNRIQETGPGPRRPGRSCDRRHR